MPTLTAVPPSPDQPTDPAARPRRAGRARALAAVVALGAALVVVPSTAAPALTPPPPPLLSRGMPTTASSIEGAAYVASNATDGNLSTRWSSSFDTDKHELTVDLGSHKNIDHIDLTWEAAYSNLYALQVSDDGALFATVAYTGATSSAKQSIPMNGARGRYVRLMTMGKATQWGVSLWEFEVFGVQSQPVSTLISQGKLTTASSEESGTFRAANATDGNPTTRWASQWSDPQWIQVDLGYKEASLDKIVLRWEAAWASTYSLYLSDDGVGWRHAGEFKPTAGGVHTHYIKSSTRFVRVATTQRATSYGVSLYELEVYALRFPPPAP